ncbi:rRNA N6-adenosine-methyltransferase ZCCHC4 isoform X1 [Topomyia yanbarensis]|uniref:rRNA N6-adenosine-methyltransferase ZCCHC4 isoform X1 n=1 Tax=Topomyia yanbarensis TaxID=2498891 RepID=UPI00273A877F|nr:rRNA N6-adenosine-methyltransferase ZCCHC4 isoform X1 [Topomyia yanbarensis]
MVKLTVVLDVKETPVCEHGPAVLFERSEVNGPLKKQFFACSATRNGTCTFKSYKCKSTSSNSDNGNDEYAMVRNAAASQKVFCIKCQHLFLKTNLQDHKNHKTQNNLTEEVLREPTRFLAPLSVDGSEAQYFFADSTLHCINGIFKQLKITKVVCLGAPRLHEYLLTRTNIDSLLLDIDNRFAWFYDKTCFLQYNMFNNYFFDGMSAQNIFIHFLSNARSKDRICIFTDPPFGCRTELLAQTIRKTNQLYNKINSTTQNILPTFWVFPYFMENYIRKEIPSMEMVDYKINYTNHKTYNNSMKGLKHGSPVRFFTNVALDLFSLPTSEGYRFCSKCNKWVHNLNLHCKICNNCVSKSGATYRHCVRCNWCVKASYKHCDKCGRCTQARGHNCKLYRMQVSCRICLVKGHVEKMCSIWKNKKKCKCNISGCVICGAKSHIVSNCPERKMLLKEEYFLGSYQNIINATC